LRAQHKHKHKHSKAYIALIICIDGLVHTYTLLEGIVRSNPLYFKIMSEKTKEKAGNTYIQGGCTQTSLVFIIRYTEWNEYMDRGWIGLVWSTLHGNISLEV